MSAQNKRAAARSALNRLMVASAIIASQTSQDGEPFWQEVEDALADRETTRKPRESDSEPVVRSRHG